MLCSKCSSVCNEKGENVKENARKEKEGRGREEGRGGEKEEERKLKANRPSSVSSSTSDNRRSCKAPVSPNKGRIVLQKSSRVKRDSGAPLKPSIENCPVPILDLDKLQYARTKARATSNCLVPKVKRLRIPGMIQAAELTPEPETVTTPSSSQETSDPTITSSRVSSSTAVPPDSMQPLKIRFAHKQSSRNSSRQYSIVKDEDSDSSDQQKENIDNESEDSEVEKRKSDHGLSEAEEGENQPLKKVFKKDSVTADPMIGACRVVPQSAPVLKISFGKESTVLKLPAPNASVGVGSTKEDEDPLKPSSHPSPRPNHTASSKAAKKALKRAKKEAQRRARLGLASPARTYLGSRSPGNLANVSPTSSPLHLASPRPLSTPSPAYTLLCPTSQKIIIKKVKRKKHKRERQPSGTEGSSAAGLNTPTTGSSGLVSRILPTSEDESLMRRSFRDCQPVGLPCIPVDESVDSPSSGQTTLQPSSSLTGQPSSSSSLNEDHPSGRPTFLSSQSSTSSSSSPSSILSGQPSSSREDQDQPSGNPSFEELPSCSLPVESALLPDGHTLCVGDVVWGRYEFHGNEQQIVGRDNNLKRPKNTTGW